MKALQEIAAAVAAGQPLPTIGPGYLGPWAFTLRRALREMNRGPKLWDTLKATDTAAQRYSDSLKEQIKAFQKSQGLDEDGIAGPLTLTEIAKYAPAAGPSPVKGGSLDAQLRAEFVRRCKAEAAAGVHDDRAHSRKYRSPKTGHPLVAAPNGVDRYLRHYGPPFVDKNGNLVPAMFCGLGLDCCLDEAAAAVGVKAPFGIHPMVKVIVQQARSAGRVIEPSAVAAGDIICFWTAEKRGKFYHVEVCTGRVHDGRVPTIGFNTSNSSINAGGYVMPRSRPVAGGHVFINVVRGVKKA